MLTQTVMSVIDQLGPGARSPPSAAHARSKKVRDEILDLVGKGRRGGTIVRVPVFGIFNAHFYVIKARSVGRA